MERLFPFFVIYNKASTVFSHVILARSISANVEVDVVTVVDSCKSRVFLGLLNYFLGCAVKLILRLLGLL